MPRKATKAKDTEAYPALPTNETYVDNIAWNAAGSYGRYGKGSYYMQDAPTKAQYAITARQTPLGKRITYIYADDIYANTFTFEFPDLELSELEKAEINSEIRQHLNEIHFYEETRRVCGFDFEQGDAVLLKYRQGDGIIYLETPQPTHERDQPEYRSFMSPEDNSKEILRVEAINALDYMIPAVGAFGSANYYNVQMRLSLNTESSTYSMFRIHPSRVIRWRSDNIDYDIYAGSSKLKACFDHLQLIQTMLHNMGNAVERFAYGQPWIRTKGIRDDKGRAMIKNILGPNPRDLTYFQTPDENIVDIKMLGVQQSQMDISKLIADNAQLVAASVGIPKQIIMSEQIGMTKPGQVINPEYFAAIDKEHNKQNPMIRQFVNSDPFFQRLFTQHKITHYEINWGLKQVMTQMEKMDYDMRKVNNAMALMNFSSLDEARNYYGEPSMEQFFAKMKNGAAICNKMYGISPQEVGAIMLNAFTFRQQGAQELIQTPEEQQAKEREEELAENNNPENVNRSQNELTPGSQKKETKAKEVERREKKNIREGAKEGGKDEDLQTQIVEDLRRELASAKTELSMRKIADKIGISPETLYKVQNGLVEYNK